MKRHLAARLAVVLTMASQMSWGADPPAPEVPRPEDLVAAAVRYGNTPEKRAAKNAARQELLQRGSDGLRAAMAFAHLENIGVQVLIQDLVYNLPAHDTAPVLLAHLDSDKTNTQRLAIYFLGFCTNAAAMSEAPDIAVFLAQEKTRGAAIRTLGKWQAAEYVPNLVAFLASTNERVRVASANALRDIGDPRAIPALIQALSDPFFTVRNTAQRALATFGSQAERELLAALPGSTPPAQRLIAATLEALDSARARRALKKFAKQQSVKQKLEPEN